MALNNQKRRRFPARAVALILFGAGGPAERLWQWLPLSAALAGAGLALHFSGLRSAALGDHTPPPPAVSPRLRRLPVRGVWSFRDRSPGKDWRFPFKLSKDGPDISKRIVRMERGAPG
jgi:hypothetical protein